MFDHLHSKTPAKSPSSAHPHPLYSPAVPSLLLHYQSLHKDTQLASEPLNYKHLFKVYS